MLLHMKVRAIISCAGGNHPQNIQLTPLAKTINAQYVLFPVQHDSTLSSSKICFCFSKLAYVLHFSVWNHKDIRRNNNYCALARKQHTSNRLVIHSYLFNVIHSSPHNYLSLLALRQLVCTQHNFHSINVQQLIEYMGCSYSDSMANYQLILRVCMLIPIKTSCKVHNLDLQDHHQHA